MVFASVLIKDIAGPNGKVLICRRNADSKWEFPQGKARTNEKPQQFVSRIAWEQLGIDVTVGQLQTRGRKLQGDVKYDFHEYYDAVNTWKMEPKSGEYTEMMWVHPSELGNYDFCGDDQNFMGKYDPWINGREIPDIRMF